MDKSEEIILEKNMNVKEFPIIKNYNKIKYSVTIIASTLIIAAVITLSIGHFNAKSTEVQTNPVARNLGFDISVSKTFNIASFYVSRRPVSVKYVLSVSETQCVNKLVINTALGAFEFGNTGMSSPGKGTKSYMTKVFQDRVCDITRNSYNSPKECAIFIGYAKGELSWEVSLESSGRYNVGLSGELKLYTERIEPSGKVDACKGEGYFAKASGKIIAVEESLGLSDFSLGMGKLEASCQLRNGRTTVIYLKDWHNAWEKKY